MRRGYDFQGSEWLDGWEEVGQLRVNQPNNKNIELDSKRERKKPRRE